MFSIKRKNTKRNLRIKKNLYLIFLCKIITPDTCFIFQNVIVKTPSIYSPQSVSSLLKKTIESGFFFSNEYYNKFLGQMEF